MMNTTSDTINLQEIIKNNLHHRAHTKSISTLLQSERKIPDYKPYYQREYVWDPIKATYFIESILLGVEIPPLIIFSSEERNIYEIVDGRQRFETLKNFFSNDPKTRLKLKKSGLNSLTGLANLTFNKLEPEVQRVFLNTTLRIIEFSTIGVFEQQEQVEDLIKKEIFFRYNSGITPLKTTEVLHAKYINEDLTIFLKEQIQNSPPWLNYFQEMFSQKNQKKGLSEGDILDKIRSLLVLDRFPIKLYVGSTGRKERLELLYEKFVEEAESIDNKEEIYENFVEKITLLYEVFKILRQKESLIYQGLFWALSILEKGNVNPIEFLNPSRIQKLGGHIQNKIEYFTGGTGSSFFSSATTDRFEHLASFFQSEMREEKIMSVNFQAYIDEKEFPLKKTQISSEEVKNTLNALEDVRMNRPDAVSKTVEDIIRDMGDNPFLLRPPYQRQEVVNIKKSSGVIESILLGIPLPTLFIYRESDHSGVMEVVDGQQRLLTILAYLGKGYKNEKGEIQYSEKNNYRLSKQLPILKELGGKNYEVLEAKFKNRLLDFELSVVYIDKKLNPKFEPRDLFVRLNNKPYPVKEHTFEMWNSYMDRKVIEGAKELNQKYKDWFYYRQQNKRMVNEEFLMVYVYLTYIQEKTEENVFKKLEIYYSPSNQLTFRFAKPMITNLLNSFNNLADQEKRKTQASVLDCIQKTEEFILKVKELIQLSVTTDKNEILVEQFNQLLGKENAAYRTQKNFFLAWFILSKIDRKMISLQKENIQLDIQGFSQQLQTLVSQSTSESSKPNLSALFQQEVEKIWSKYQASLD